MTVLVEVPGVLRTEAGAPVQALLDTARGMCQYHRVVFASEDDRDEIFLTREGVIGHAGFRQLPLLEALAEERTVGYVDLVITPDTETAREVARQGISVLLCSASTVVNPKWRPTRKSWGDISKEELWPSV